MKNNLINNFDKRLSYILAEWERASINQNEVIIKRALQSNLIPLLFNFFRGENSLSNTTAKKYLNRFKSIRVSLFHIIKSFLWTVKYLISYFYLRNQEKIIVCSLNTQRRISKIYLKNLVKYANVGNFVVLQYGTFTSLYCLFHPTVICYPTIHLRIKKYFQRESLVESEDSIVNSLQITLNKLTGKKLLEISKINQFISLYLVLFKDFEAFLKKILLRSKIRFIIQDGEYTSSNVIYSFLSNQQNIPTVALDHSIIVYNHLYTEMLSKYYFCWGEHSKKRIYSISKNKPKVNEISRADLSFGKISKAPKKRKYFVYCLSSFVQPLLVTTGRSLSLTLKYLEEIEKIISKKYPYYELLIKPHPEDGAKFLRKYKHSIYNKSLDNVFDSAACFFSEDSTITLELLMRNVPFIYLLDKRKTDYYGFDAFGLFKLTSDLDTLEKRIEENLAVDPLEQNREKMIKYYFGNDFGAKYNLFNSLQKYFNNES